MKKSFLLVLLVIGCLNGFSQSTVENGSALEKNSLTEEDNNLYNTAGVEKIPEFPGGMKEFYYYIGKKYKVPNVKGLSGKIFVTFVVEKDGSLNEIKVLRDIGYGTGEEAIRVLKNSPKWSPAEQNGKPVRVLYSLPIAIQTK